MNFEISLLPALGGYWLLTHLIPTRTEALRQSGYHIAFRSAVVGLLLFVLAYLILHSVIVSARLFDPVLHQKFQESVD